jgi:hypothetical protein
VPTSLLVAGAKVGLPGQGSELGLVEAAENLQLFYAVGR